MLGKVLAVGLAVGLDVFVSMGVGRGWPCHANPLRVGFAFATAKIAMQFIGYELGPGAGTVLGELAGLMSSPARVYRLDDDP